MIGDLSVSEFGARLASSDAALRESTLVPLGVAERCAELLELALRAAELGNRFLISDAAVGAELAAGAGASRRGRGERRRPRAGGAHGGGGRRAVRRVSARPSEATRPGPARR